MRALIVLNFQNDYSTGGPCFVSGVLRSIPLINNIKKKFDLVIFVKDWHPKDHTSFNKYKGNWEPHCIQNTEGAELVSGLIVSELDPIIEKGTLKLHDSASAFYNAKTAGKLTSVNNILKRNKIKDIYLCGTLLEEYVFSTAIDAVKFGYTCYIIKEICLTNKDQYEKEQILKSLDNFDIKYISIDDI